MTIVFLLTKEKITNYELVLCIFQINADLTKFTFYISTYVVITTYTILLSFIKKTKILFCQKLSRNEDN